MARNHPKRRKDKYNPYTIWEQSGHYHLSFTDGQGVQHEMQIPADLFTALNQFELDDLATLNEWDRHIEHLKQTEQALNRRALARAMSVEDTVLQSLEYERLHKAIMELSETQRRRLTLYYFRGLTYEQIAKLEGCTFQAVAKSVLAAEKKIRIFLIEG